MILIFTIGVISAILFLLDIKYGFIVREFLMNIQSYNNDHDVSVGNLIFAFCLIFFFGVNIVISVFITIGFFVQFLSYVFSKISMKKFLRKRVF